MTNIMYDTHACILAFYTYQLDGFVDPRVDASVAGIEQKNCSILQRVHWSLIQVA